MKANEEKYHVLSLTNENALANVGAAQMQNSSCKWILQIKTDYNLIFSCIVNV